MNGTREALKLRRSRKPRESLQAFSQAPTMPCWREGSPTANLAVIGCHSGRCNRRCWTKAILGDVSGRPPGVFKTAEDASLVHPQPREPLFGCQAIRVNPKCVAFASFSQQSLQCRTRQGSAKRLTSFAHSLPMSVVDLELD